jgi:hypothetical protein
MVCSTKVVEFPYWALKLTRKLRERKRKREKERERERNTLG